MGRLVGRYEDLKYSLFGEVFMSMNLKTVSKRRTCFGLSDDPRNVESTPAYAIPVTRVYD